MEKYRKFADEATGVNPFLPGHLIGARRDPALVHRVVRSSFLCVSLVVRIPLIVLGIVLLGVSDLLSFIPLVSQLIIRPLLRPIAALLTLASIGLFLNPFMKTEDFRRLKMKRPSADKCPPCSVWVAPFHGFIDILVYTVTVRPSAFVFPTLDGSLLTCSTVYSALATAIACPIPLARHSTVPPPHSLIFASAAPSNGHGLVATSPTVLECLPRDFQICKIDYNDRQSPVSPHHMVNSWISHLLNLMINSFFVVHVTVLPEPVSDKSQLNVLMARLSPSCPVTNLDSGKYVEFKQYWNETQTTQYHISKRD